MGAIIQSILNVILGVKNDIVRWITKLIASVYDFIAAQINGLWHAAVQLYDDAVKLADEIQAYAVRLATSFADFVNRIFADFVHWTEDAFNTVLHYAQDVLNWAIQQVDYLLHLIEKAYNDIERWVIQNIWDPLYNGITSALNWIEREGAYVYYLLTHPDKLALLLGTYLWQSWLDLAKAYGGPLARWIFRHIESEAGTFADLLETIIAHWL